MEQNKTIITTRFSEELNLVIENTDFDKLFVLTDENTKRFCLPELTACKCMKDFQLISLPEGDESKNIESAVKIWQFLTEHKATRKSLMINLGGGMITDIGGFTASTFKRGIRYINVSTTLLGAVDAATGGKTGINFLGYKNEIGVFSPALAVLINIDFFKTLSIENIRSGFAEMVKHALIDTDEEWNKLLKFDLENIDFNELRQLLEKSIRVKERIVKEDPKEQNIRKALNLGHTFGHAFESFSYRAHQPVLHGYAVIWGTLCELYLSVLKLGFPKEELLRLKYLIKEYYPVKLNFSCNDYEALLELMTHDKKNESDEINFTLLGNVGDIRINQTARKEEIYECLDFFREG